MFTAKKLNVAHKYGHLQLVLVQFKHFLEYSNSFKIISYVKLEAQKEVDFEEWWSHQKEGCYRRSTFAFFFSRPRHHSVIKSLSAPLPPLSIWCAAKPKR